MVRVIGHHGQSVQRLPIRHIGPGYLDLLPGIEKVSKDVALGRLGLHEVLQTVIFTRELSELGDVGEDKERTVGDRVFVAEFKG